MVDKQCNICWIRVKTVDPENSELFLIRVYVWGNNLHSGISL